MRRPHIAGSLLALALLLSACAANEAPNWTYAPSTPQPSVVATQAPAGSQAAEASAGASAAASSAEAPGGSAAASGGSGGSGSGAVVDITALNVDWTTKDVTAPANTAFKIHFDNQDASTPHNIVIKDAQGQQFLSTDLLTGVAQADYDVPALAPGTYSFVCQVHPNMVGNLTVK